MCRGRRRKPDSGIEWPVVDGAKADHSMVSLEDRRQEQARVSLYMSAFLLAREDASSFKEDASSFKDELEAEDSRKAVPKLQLRGGGGIICGERKEREFAGKREKEEKEKNALEICRNTINRSSGIEHQTPVTSSSCSHQSGTHLNNEI